jgi:hypothetical protein
MATILVIDLSNYVKNISWQKKLGEKWASPRVWLDPHNYPN